MTAGYLVTGAGPGAGRDGQPELGPGSCSTRSTASVVGPGRSGRRGRHPHPSRPRRRGGRRGPGVPVGHRLRPRARGPVTSSTRHASSTPPRASTERLLDSLYGRLDPTPAERIHVLDDGEEIRVWPGPCPRHGRLARAMPSTTWRCTTRPAASSSPVTPSGSGCPTPGCLRPSTPPPDFDLDQAVHSLQRFAAAPSRRPRPGPLRTACPTRRRCSTRPRTRCAGGRRWRSGPGAQGADIAAALDEAFAGDIGEVEPAQREKLETLNGVHSNAAGFRRWLETRAAGRGEPGGPGLA